MSEESNSKKNKDSFVKNKDTSAAAKKKKWIRRIAVWLIVALLVNGLFSTLVSVSISAQQVVDANTAAENYLANNTDYVNQSPIDRAKTILRNAFSGYSDELKKHYDALSVAIGKEKYEDALKEAEECLLLISSEHTQYADIMTKKGCLQALLGDYQSARDTFNKLLEKNDDAAQAHLLLAELLLETGEIGQATDHLVRYTELTPDDKSQLPVIAELFYGQNNYSKAIEYGTKAVKSGCTEDMDLMNAIGLSKLLTGDYKGALEYIDRAVVLGETYIEQNKKEPVNAIALMSETYYYRGLCKLTIGSVSEAIPDYSTAIDMGYGTSLCYYNRAVCELQIEDYEKCYEDMKVVIKMNDEPELVEIAQTIVDAIDSALAGASASEASAAVVPQLPDAAISETAPSTEETVQESQPVSSEAVQTEAAQTETQASEPKVTEAPLETAPQTVQQPAEGDPFSAPVVQ